MSHHEKVTELPPNGLLGNRAIEDAAIAFVIDYERRFGRVAQDTRGRGAAADVESDDRIIEVKAAGGSARGADLWLETRQVEEARHNPNFHVYVVDNVRQADPEHFGLVDLHGEVLARLLQRAREQHYYTVPVPVKIYDDNREMSNATGTPSAPPAPVVRQGPPGSELLAMSRTSAIMHVLSSHDGPMRPIEVWTELKRAGRENDPKADVNTTMFDLWKAGRIGKIARGQYYGLGRDDSPVAPPVVASEKERRQSTRMAAFVEPPLDATNGIVNVSDGEPEVRGFEGRRGGARFLRWIRGLAHRGRP